MALPVTLRGTSFTGNQVGHAGTSAFSIARACDNVFTGNNVQDNGLGVVFLASTGGNVWRGKPGVVQDNGSFDCDGSADANQVTGARAPADSVAAPAFSSLSAAAAHAADAGNGRYPTLQ